MSTSKAQTRSPLLPAGTWEIDPAHSSIEFAVKHMMIATVRGRFSRFRGEIDVRPSGALTAVGTVDVASIDTNESDRDEHLRSPDFFDAANHPEISFVSSQVRVNGDGVVRGLGRVTIRGVTRNVELTGTVLGTGRDPYGNERIALELTGELDRTDFGLKWNQPLEAGGLLVGDTIKLSLDLSVVRAAEQLAA